MISGPQPGFLVLCGRTGMPVEASTAVDSFPVESMEEAPAVFETMRSFRPGYASLRRLKFSYMMLGLTCTSRKKYLAMLLHAKEGQITSYGL